MYIGVNPYKLNLASCSSFIFKMREMKVLALSFSALLLKCLI